MNDTSPLVVGAGGLLGSAVCRRLGGDAVRASVPWGSDDAFAALDGLAAAVTRGPQSEPWQVFWCAGAGVNGTPAEVLAREVDEFAAFTDALVHHAGARRGGLFLASSAGGVYAGCPGPAPFTERHATAPLSPYGETKLAMEDVARRAFAGSPHSLAVGRVANLYGPGQNLGKMQGLISHICRALVTDQPLNLYVPIDTIRDYIYADDAADIAIHLLRRCLDDGLTDVTKILASGRGATIGELIGLARAIAKRRPPVVYAASPLASFQSSDLRLHSVVLPELDAYASTPLDAGMAATARAIESLSAAGTLTR